MLQWLDHWWRYALFAAATITATAAADTMIPDPFLSRLASLAIPTFGGSKMILELFDKKGMERKLQEKEREADEQRRENRELRREADDRRREADDYRREADEQRREADEQRREADEQRREADEQRRENEELRRRLEELEGNGPANPPPAP